MIDKVLSLFAPHHCYICRQVGMVVCDNCKYNIINERFDVCVGCGDAAVRYGLCGRCQTPYVRAWVVDVYRGPIGEAIKGMKIVSMRETAVVLGEILAEVLPTLPPEAVIVPVPTVRSHVRQRGFDHTKIMAETVAGRIGVPVKYLLRRVGNAMQRGATAAQRRRQAREAFVIETPIDPDIVYLLIDDVVTTGATIREASLRLREAGAKEVWVAVLVREALD